MWYWKGWVQASTLYLLAREQGDTRGRVQETFRYVVMLDNRPPAVCAFLQASHNTETNTLKKKHTFSLTVCTVLAQWLTVSSVWITVLYTAMPANLSMTVLTPFNVNWEVLSQLWIQPPVLFLKWFQSMCVLLGLFSFGRLLHQLTTSRLRCIHLQTSQGTLTADQICDGLFKSRWFPQ